MFVKSVCLPYSLFHVHSSIAAVLYRVREYLRKVVYVFQIVETCDSVVTYEPITVSAVRSLSPGWFHPIYRVLKSVQYFERW